MLFLEFIIEQDWLFENVFKFLTMIYFAKMDTAICSKGLRQKYILRLLSYDGFMRFRCMQASRCKVSQIPMINWLLLRYPENEIANLSFILEELLLLKENPKRIKCWRCHRSFPRITIFQRDAYDDHNKMGCDQIIGRGPFSKLKVLHIDGKSNCEGLKRRQYYQKSQHIPFYPYQRSPLSFACNKEEKIHYEMERDKN